MTYPFRSQLVTSRAYPILLLDGVIGHRERHQLLRLLTWLVFLLVIILVVASLSAVIPSFESKIPFLQTAVPRLVGGLFLIFSIWLTIYLLETYFRARYFAPLSSEQGDLFTFEIGQLLYRATEPDPLIATLTAESGMFLALRLGLPQASVLGFIETHRGVVPTGGSPRVEAGVMPTLPIELGKVLTLERLTGWLFDQYPDFAKYLLGFEIQRDDLTGATSWLTRQLFGERLAEAWWTRERLARLPGLAKDWSYGETTHLDRYATDLRLSPEATLHPDDPLEPSATTLQVETILSRDAEANVLLLNPADSASGRAVVFELTKLIKRGRVVPVLEHRRPMFLVTARLLAAFDKAQALETELLTILHEVISAGNILLIIDDLPLLIANARQLGAPIEKLLDPFLTSAVVPVLALAGLESYHRILEPLPELMNRLETVMMTAVDPKMLLDKLEDQALTLERRHEILFTYQALLALLDLANERVTAGSIDNEAADLLLELPTWARVKKFTLLGKNEALAYAEEKLKIPVGLVGAVEREKLLQLEVLLHARVVGQDPAIVAIAGAMRRSRAGIRNVKRPIGSFLFLGPTGVGKTETAKALAFVFFGSEESFIRLDMSEYQGAESLSRLIGSRASGVPGILANLVRERPYSVLLLDEFEKADASLRDLFLQILDEGFFTDAQGERVSLRHQIIIATSNAGAPLIWDMVKDGRRLFDEERTIIDSIIKQGIFKPELINRFDGVILFNPLQTDELRAVAKLMLEQLAGRLKEKGMIVKITDPTLDRLVERGADQQFGARPMRRFIQVSVEQLIADAMLVGKLKSGQTVELIPTPALLSGRPADTLAPFTLTITD
jgi:ATP-dependent Clp protease ATP-binding subunit ClpC